MTEQSDFQGLVDVYAPLASLKPVAENIWIVDGPVEHMQQFGLNVPFPTRMTVIRLPGDQIIPSFSCETGRWVV